MTMAIPPARGLFGVLRSVTDWTIGTATLVVVLPARVATLLSAVELLLARVTQLVDAAAGVVDDAAATVDRVSPVVATAETTVSEASVVALRAGNVVTNAGTASAQAQQLLDAYRDSALRFAPEAGQLLDSISAREVQALIKLVDVLPTLVEALQRDVIPILSTMDQVGPDVTALLDVFRDVREGVVGIPGFNFFRKRGEHLIDPRHQPDDPA